ncbi:MAG: hypothetical protein PHE50_05355 [Dehalococcoidales bacterium]|nr:hypothetical protein [Dehalococcoidales bacterium]
MNKRLRTLALALTGTVFAIISAIGGIAWAAGSESADINTAATINPFRLKVNNQFTGKLSISNAVPGSGGQTIYNLENTGNQTSCLSINIPYIYNVAGKTGKYMDGIGDLGANTLMHLYLDTDNSGNWSSGDIRLDANGQGYTDATRSTAINDYNGVVWERVMALSPNEHLDLILEWIIPAATGNEIQGDSVHFDIVFSLQ